MFTDLPGFFTTWIIPFAPFLSVVVAFIAFINLVAINLRNKRIDTIINLNTRYDDLYKFKIEIQRDSEDKSKKLTVKHNTKSYFRRFWGLKSDQLDYWIAGYIDPETMLSWFSATLDLFMDEEGSPRKVGEWSYRKGWENSLPSHEHINIRLADLIKKMIDDISKRPSKAERIAILFCELEEIERLDRRLIRMLAPFDIYRVKFSKLEKMLTYEVRVEIYKEQLKRKMAFKDLKRRKRMFDFTRRPEGNIF
jgi:hypothetical protein